MRKLEEIVKKIFSARDFQIEEVTDGYFKAKRETIIIAVFCKESTTSISKPEVLRFLENAPNNVDRRIFVTNSRFDDNVSDISKKEEILFWDREKLEREIGKAVLMKDFDFFIPSKEIEEEKVEEKEPLTIFEGEILKPNISRDKAEMIAKKFVHPISFELNLVPYYLYDYQCEFLIAEKSIEKTAGTVGINGVTKFGELWFNFDFTENLEIQHKKILPSFDFQTALDIAKNQIIELNTRSIEATTNSESVVIIEKKKIKPKEENIEIKARGIIYLPLWVVAGHNGKVVIDAVNGDVNEKKLFEIS